MMNLYIAEIMLILIKALKCYVKVIYFHYL